MTKKILLTTLAVLCSSMAFASDEGFYLGFNGIYGNIDLENKTTNGVTYTANDTNSIGGGFTAGYNLSKNFALDYAIDGFDRIDYDGENAPSMSYWFTYLAAKPMIDLWKFNAFIELGGAYVDYTQHNHGSTPDTTNSEIRPFGGIGFGFNFTPNLELDLSVNRIQDTTTPITFGMLTFTYHAVQRYEDSGFIAD